MPMSTPEFTIAASVSARFNPKVNCSLAGRRDSRSAA